MLLELVVENYAVVERLRVHFHAGLNLLTGETGSGGNPGTDGKPGDGRDDTSAWTLSFVHRRSTFTGVS